MLRIPTTLLTRTRSPATASKLTQQQLHQHHFRNFHPSIAIMGVQKTTISPGSGPSPKKGDTVTIEYTGWLRQPDGSKGNQFDSSVGRGDFRTAIGVGQVIKGWDEGVLTMQLGEKATLDITSDYAYGARGFPPVIPANSALLFDVELKKIN